MSNLKDAKVDDYLVIGNSYDERLFQVSRLTDTQVVAGNTKFNKKTGYRVGDSGAWGRMSARLATAVDIKRITQKTRCRDLRAWLDRLNVTPENLVLVEAFYQSIKDAKDSAIPAQQPQKEISL